MILSLSVPSKQADNRINDIDLVHQYQRALTTPTNLSSERQTNVAINEADTCGTLERASVPRVPLEIGNLQGCYQGPPRVSVDTLHPTTMVRTSMVDRDVGSLRKQHRQSNENKKRKHMPFVN